MGWCPSVSLALIDCPLNQSMFTGIYVFNKSYLLIYFQACPKRQQQLTYIQWYKVIDYFICFFFPFVLPFAHSFVTAKVSDEQLLDGAVRSYYKHFQITGAQYNWQETQLKKSFKVQ